MDETEQDRNHAEKMAKRQAARRKMMAEKTEERGLLIVHTGLGKGKSTAAFGMALRAIGHHMPVGIIQFVKGAWDTGERVVLERFADQVTIMALGEGFSWDTQDRQRDLAAAERAWEQAEAMISNYRHGLVILDELNIVIRAGHLSLDRVLATLARRSPDLHIVITGRHARPELIEAADLVTEMTMIKHPFRSGVKAQRGVEF